MDDDAFDVWLRIPARPENVALARQALAGLCEALPTSTKVLADVKLAVTEACTNCVVHAYPNGLAAEDAVIEVEAATQPEELVVIVRDFGRGISPNTETPGLGLGLPLIAALSRTVEFRGGGTIDGTEVVMSFSLDDDLGDGSAR